MTLDRYRRQTAFRPFGDAGQRRLSEASVLVVGCGALGSSAAQLLVRAGLGRMLLVDPDVVQADNLHRQFLFMEQDALQAVPKVVAAARTLASGNSTIRIETFRERFDAENADRFVSGVDLILDGTDNLETRYRMNEAALRLGKPFVCAGLSGARGQVFTVLPGITPCLVCVFGEPDGKLLPKSLEEEGVLAPIVQYIAAVETMEVIKILGGHPEALSGRLLSTDLWDNTIRQIDLESLGNKRCPLCSRYFL